MINEVVQIYLPSTDIDRSVAWYVQVFGYQVIWKEKESANLKLAQGPLLFLKKSTMTQPIQFISADEESPVISYKSSDIFAMHARLQSEGYHVSEINEYGGGENGSYMDFYIRDPDGNLLEVNSYPDLSLEKYRGY